MFINITLMSSQRGILLMSVSYSHMYMLVAPHAQTNKRHSSMPHPSQKRPVIYVTYNLGESEASLGRLDHLGLRWRRELSAEDTVPETAGYAEAVLVVGEVVLQVVLLEFTPVGWEAVRRRG